MPRSITPPRRDQSVISRVVETVRDTAGSIGSSASNIMPSRRTEEMDISGGGGGSSDPDEGDEF
jgi:hypothetical protein